MTTSHTQPLHDGAPYSLRDYILSCARSMGAFYGLRDDEITDGLPNPRKIHESYLQRVVNAQETVTQLQEQTMDWWEGEERNTRLRANEETADYITSRLQIATRYELMLASVKTLGLPDSLQSFREFMEQQLLESLAFDCDVKSAHHMLRQPMTAEEYRQMRMSRAVRDLQDALKAVDAERNQIALLNSWVDDLRAVVEDLQ